MLQMIFLILVKILVPHPLNSNFALTFEPNPRPSENFRGNLLWVPFFKFWLTIRLYYYKICLLVRWTSLTPPSSPYLRGFAIDLWQMHFRFSISSEKTFVTISPKNCNLPLITLLAIFKKIVIHVSLLILFHVISEPVSKWYLIFL